MHRAIGSQRSDFLHKASTAKTTQLFLLKTCVFKIYPILKKAHRKILEKILKLNQA